MSSTDEFDLVLAQLIADIETCFPELHEPLAKVSSMSSEAVFNHFCDRTTPIAALIMLNDETIFNQDTPTDFLPGISFAAMWKDSGIENDTRECIWEYLSALLTFTYKTAESTAKAEEPTAEAEEPTAEAKEPIPEVNESQFKEAVDEIMSWTQEIANDFEAEMEAEVCAMAAEEKEGKEDAPKSIEETTQAAIDKLREYVHELLDGKLQILALRVIDEIKDDILHEGAFREDMTQNTELQERILAKVQGILDDELASGFTQEELINELKAVAYKIKSTPTMFKWVKKMFNKFTENDDGRLNRLLTKMGIGEDALQGLLNMVGLGRPRERVDEFGDPKRKLNHTRLKARMRERREAKRVADLERLAREDEVNACREAAPLISEDEIIALFAEDKTASTSTSNKKKKGKKRK